MSAGEMGALRASAISWAFWPTLPLRVRMLRMASPRLFCRPWPRPAGDQPLLASVLVAGIHRSVARAPGDEWKPGAALRGLGLRERMLDGASIKSGNFSSFSMLGCTQKRTGVIFGRLECSCTWSKRGSLGSQRRDGRNERQRKRRKNALSTTSRRAHVLGCEPSKRFQVRIEE